MIKEYKGNTYIRLFLVFFALIILFVGGLMYLAFRPTTLKMFSWAYSLGVNSYIEKLRLLASDVCLSDFVVYSLPDGLWIASYLLLVNAFLPVVKEKEYLFWILALPSFAVSSEFGQFVHIVPGCFDLFDVLSYLTPVIINLLYYICKTHKKNSKIQFY